MEGCYSVSGSRIRANVRRPRGWLISPARAGDVLSGRRPSVLDPETVPSATRWRRVSAGIEGPRSGDLAAALGPPGAAPGAGAGEEAGSADRPSRGGATHERSGAPR